MIWRLNLSLPQESSCWPCRRLCQAGMVGCFWDDSLGFLARTSTRVWSLGSQVLDGVEYACKWGYFKEILHVYLNRIGYRVKLWDFDCLWLLFLPLCLWFLEWIMMWRAGWWVFLLHVSIEWPFAYVGGK